MAAIHAIIIDINALWLLIKLHVACQPNENKNYNVAFKLQVVESQLEKERLLNE